MPIGTRLATEYVDGAQPAHARAVELDREYVAASPSERREDFYARGLRERFSSG